MILLLGLLDWVVDSQSSYDLLGSEKQGLGRSRPILEANRRKGRFVAQDFSTECSNSWGNFALDIAERILAQIPACLFFAQF